MPKSANKLANIAFIRSGAQAVRPMPFAEAKGLFLLLQANNADPLHLLSLNDKIAIPTNAAGPNRQSTAKRKIKSFSRTSFNAMAAFFAAAIGKIAALIFYPVRQQISQKAIDI